MDEPAPPLDLGSEARHRRLALEFDFLKHLTSLSLFGVGGVVTLAGSIFAATPDKDRLWLAMLGFGVAATLALWAQHSLLDKAETGRIGRFERWLRDLSALTLGAATGGLGMFSYTNLP